MIELYKELCTGTSASALIALMAYPKIIVYALSYDKSRDIDAFFLFLFRTFWEL